MKYEVNNIGFKTKADMKAHVRNIIDTNGVGHIKDVESFNFLLEFFKYHPGYIEKRGCGIESVEIRKNLEWGHNEFWIVRVDGTSTDISLNMCLRMKHPTLEQYVRSCCREAVFIDIKNFKIKHFYDKETSICPITNKTYSIKESHVHHNEPWSFDRIFKMWWEKKKDCITLDDIGGCGDGDVVKKFVKTELSDNFRRFHNSKSDLQVLSVEGHRKIKSKHS